MLTFSWLAGLVSNTELCGGLRVKLDFVVTCEVAKFLCQWKSKFVAHEMYRYRKVETIGGYYRDTMSAPCWAVWGAPGPPQSPSGRCPPEDSRSDQTCQRVISHQVIITHLLRLYLVALILCQRPSSTLVLLYSILSIPLPKLNENWINHWLIKLFYWVLSASDLDSAPDHLQHQEIRVRGCHGVTRPQQQGGGGGHPHPQVEQVGASD